MTEGISWRELSSGAGSGDAFVREVAALAAKGKEPAVGSSWKWIYASDRSLDHAYGRWSHRSGLGAVRPRDSGGITQPGAFPFSGIVLKRERRLCRCRSSNSRRRIIVSSPSTDRVKTAS